VTPVVEVDSLRKSYGGVERIHGISFEVRAGEVFGFLGTNGAGKTTTIEILEGYRPRNSGRVSVLGTDPAHADRAWRNRIGLVLQECELNPVYTVRETVTMFARYFWHPTDVAATIGVVGLADKADDRVGQLSGGQKRRLDVALGLIGDPEVLFLDEPTTGLDPAARREMWTMVEGLRDAGKTIFLTTHYMDEAQHLADRIIILRDGDIAAQGTAEELARSQGNRTEVTFTLPAGVTLDRLRGALGVAVEARGTLARFEAGDAQRDLKRLLDWAEQERVALADLEVTVPTLDDVFVQLAGPVTRAEGRGSGSGQGSGPGQGPAPGPGSTA
jgi:ABC-2 type transport system ATP-binding protein